MKFNSQSNDGLCRANDCKSLPTTSPYLVSAKNLLEKIEDASTELMMGNGDRVMLRLGEAMFEATEDEATEFCEIEMERHQKMVDKLNEEEADILEQQSGLKKLLYGRFGKSINLEER